MMTSTFVFNTKMMNIQLRSSKPIIKSDAQKHIVECSFEHKFYDLKFRSWSFFFLHIP